MMGTRIGEFPSDGAELWPLGVLGSCYYSPRPEAVGRRPGYRLRWW